MSRQLTEKISDRAERRRDQVLQAASTCFREEGFQGASMTRIAARAGMSVGHIYQYFQNKEAIVIAMVERDLCQFRAQLQSAIAESKNDSEAIVHNLIAAASQMLDGDRAATMCEVLAEVGRNPKIAELHWRIDRDLRELCGKLLRMQEAEGKPPLDNIAMRTEMLLIAMQGATSRMSGKEKGTDGTVEAGLDWLIRAIMSPEINVS